MGIDVRFYYASLVAILVFFGLGVIVGIGVSRQPSAEFIYKRIERQLKNYRAEVTKQLQQRDSRIRQLEEQLDSLRESLNQNEQFIRSATPIVVHGRLLYRNVALLITAPDKDLPFLDSLTRTLEQANASVRSTTRLLPKALTYTGDELPALVNHLKRLGFLTGDAVGPEPAARAALHKKLLSHLLGLVRNGDSKGFLRAYERSGWVRLSGDYSVPVGAVVLLGSADSARDMESVRKGDVTIIRALKQMGVKVVGCETAITQTSVMEIYQQEKIPTVDNVDTPIGQISLVYALSGVDGSYGFKPTAQSAFPKMEEAK